MTSSSYTGWTTGDLGKDIEEVAQAVAYFRGLWGTGGGASDGDSNAGHGLDDSGEVGGVTASETGKVVLMGHSTGAQVCMEYVTSRMRRGTIPSATSTGALNDTASTSTTQNFTIRTAD